MSPNMAAAAILDFQKFEIFTVGRLFNNSRRVIVPSFVKIGQTVAETSRFNGFQNGDRPPSWICLARIWTTHDEYLVVSIFVQNLRESMQ